MQVLITGGAGYIGSHTVRLLRESGDSVVVLDTLETGHRAAIGECPLIQGSVTDEPLLAQVFAEYAFDAVIHFAAYKSVPESMLQPERYFFNNVVGTLALLTAMQRAGVPHLVFSSTAAVYAPTEQMPIDEEAPLQPPNPYGESKRQVEQMLHWFSDCYGLRSVSLRYFNAAGASFDAVIGEDPRTAPNLIPVAVQSGLGRRPALRIYGADYPTPDGTCIRDYVHVVDLADAHRLALLYLQSGGASTTLNLGTGRGVSVREVVTAIEAVSGQALPVEFAGRRPGDPAAVWADSRRAGRQLGWRPRYGLGEIVQTAWRWHARYPDGYATATAGAGLGVG